MITAGLLFQTPTLMVSARRRSMYIPCASPRANCGVNRQIDAIPSTLTYGTIILKQRDSVPDSEAMIALPHLPRDQGGPVFDEPWQATAFGLAVRLSAQGHFTWKE